MKNVYDNQAQAGKESYGKKSEREKWLVRQLNPRQQEECVRREGKSSIKEYFYSYTPSLRASRAEEVFISESLLLMFLVLSAHFPSINLFQ